MAKKADKVDPNSFSKYEKARMVGSRALQLSMGAPFLLKLKTAELEKMNYSPVKIAMAEFNAGIIPITVRRPEPTLEAEETTEAKEAS